MSEDWSKLRDVDLLADGRVRLDFTIPLAELPRLRSQLARADGAITGRASFDRERELPAAEVEIAGCVALTCQRCLEPFDFAVRSRGRVALVADAAEAEHAPEELETIFAPGHRISLRDLVEEELLLALPLVPLHATEACAPSGLPSASGRAAPHDRGAARDRGAPQDRGAPPERGAPHGRGARETPGSLPGAGPGSIGETHRPFERLDELFKRSK